MRRSILGSLSAVAALALAASSGAAIARPTEDDLKGYGPKPDRGGSLRVIRGDGPAHRSGNNRKCNVDKQRVREKMARKSRQAQRRKKR